MMCVMPWGPVMCVMPWGPVLSLLPWKTGAERVRLAMEMVATALGPEAAAEARAAAEAALIPNRTLRELASTARGVPIPVPDGMHMCPLYITTNKLLGEYQYALLRMPFYR